MNGIAHGHDLLRSHTHALRSAPSPHRPHHPNYEWGLTSFAAVLFIASRKRRNNDADPHRASSFHSHREFHPSRGGTLTWFISKIRLLNRRTGHRSHMNRASRKLTVPTSWYEPFIHALRNWGISQARLTMRALFRAPSTCPQIIGRRDISAVQNVPWNSLSIFF